MIYHATSLERTSFAQADGRTLRFLLPEDSCAGGKTAREPLTTGALLQRWVIPTKSTSGQSRLFLTIKVAYKGI
jgi:hypothetical protein